MTTSSIYIKNASTLVTDEQAATMTRAVAYAARFHAAPAWGYAPRTILFQGVKASPPTAAAVITLYDDSDQAGDLGWHTEGPDASIYGRVFAAPVLANGGNALTADLSVASVLSHEVIETLLDPACNRWAQRGDGTLIAVEGCDPVESDSYIITIPAPGETVSGTVSNFVLPSWFDPDTNVKATDHLGLLTAPFSIRPTGYCIEMQESDAETAVWGEKYPEWRKATKDSVTARTARRVSAGKPQTSLA